MLGIPVARLSTIVWSLAAGLSFLALWLQSGVLGVPLGGALRVTALVQALAALVIGRMTHLPTIALTAVALGVLEYGIRWNYSDPRLADPLMAAAVLIALLLQRHQTLRRDTDATSTWRGVESIRPLAAAVHRDAGGTGDEGGTGRRRRHRAVGDPDLPARRPGHQGDGGRRVRRHRPVAHRADRVGRADLPRPDGLRRPRRGRRLDVHVTVGPRPQPGRRSPVVWPARSPPCSSGCRPCACAGCTSPSPRWRSPSPCSRGC